MNIRKTALAILREAEQKDQYISLALSAWLTRAQDTDERDRALLTALVYGTTEKRVALDYYLSLLCDRPPEKIGARLRMALRLGLYQLMFLDRIPPHAAVAEIVALGKSPGERAFLNGVLRGYLRKKEDLPLPADPTERLAVRYAFPTETVQLLQKNLGKETEAVLAALSALPPTTIAVNTTVTDRASALKRLCAAGLDAEPTAAPRGIRIRGNIPYKTLCDLIGEDAFFVQDEASQIAVTVLSPTPGALVADVCACPGSKSFHAALCMENRGSIRAFDLHASKLPLIESGAKRLHLDIITAAEHDSTTPVAELVGKCDFVICDVPCSGLGVMAKKPEIRFHAAASAAELAPLGYRILCAAAQYLKPGGKLLFSTCTLNRAENEENYERFFTEHDGFARTDFSLGAYRSQNGCLTLLPDAVHDGFFISLLTRQNKHAKENA